jgi:hypothetical protein
VPLPYPVLVDGEEVESRGSVYVRWVLPLPADPSLVVPERIVRSTAEDAIKPGAGDGEAEGASRDPGGTEG